jgi:hypothetical protein
MMLALDLGVFNRRVHALDSLAIQRFGPLFFLSTRTIRRRTHECPRTGPGGNMAHGFREVVTQVTGFGYHQTFRIRSSNILGEALF